jgi:hypothetical protein
LGPPATLGKVTTVDLRAVTTADDDIVVLGALANGRITFSRGSSTMSRRVAPRVLLPPARHDVLGFAAAANGAGLVLVVLRGEPDAPGEAHPEMEVELNLLDTSGEQLSVWRWTSTSGFDPQIARCGDTTYVAWRTLEGVVATAVSATGERTPAPSLSNENVNALGPIVCLGGEARLLATWNDRAKKVSIARLTPTGKGESVWRVIPTSGVIYDVRGSTGGVFLFLDDRDASKSTVEVLDLATESVSRSPLVLPALAPCLVRDGEKSAICGLNRPVEVSSKCHRITSQLLVTFHGDALTAPHSRQASAIQQAPGDARDSPFFIGPSRIEDPDALSESARATLRSRLRCGETGWSPLRAALAEWCRGKGGMSKRVRPFCDTSDSESLLFQSINCTDVPVSCGKVPGREVLEVDRGRYDAGRKVQIQYMNCAATLERVNGRWKVSDADCAADL